ncbi:glycine cleavage system protein GcvH [Zavarzinia aquatilis]|uniref:Glycine cleavage system H protein n=1 Tax=Zavarzinia aquatilis TaxID=2211142 RepID=A0A317E2X5_9PROT|nr:glycine cleavage system protein GcvH [Zavarzinia aquatilis]PWR21438.1 glycine cleavage system protein GcvH [Zavarzinia aquatilis]
MTVKFTKDHEWIAVSGTTGRVGITVYAQSQLGDLVYVEVPAIGKALTKGGEAAVVESVKAASEVYAPVSGKVTAANDALADAPETVNADAEGEGWLYEMEIADPAELGDLMDRAGYDAYVETLH